MAANSVNTVFDYLAWRGDLTLKSSAFNEVDGVILARLSYIPFEYLGADNGTLMSAPYFDYEGFSLMCAYSGGRMAGMYAAEAVA